MTLYLQRPILKYNMEQGFANFFNEIIEEEHIQHGNYSKVEYAAFKAFILHSYDLSIYLRNQRQPQSNTYDASYLAMIRYIERSNKVSGNVLYRGTRLPNDIFQQLIQTGEYCDAAFVSTTYNIDNAQQHMKMDQNEDPPDTHTMVLFSILSSHTGVDISDLSPIQVIDGQEVIFKPQTVFKIVEHHQTQIKYNDGSSRIMYEISLQEV